MTEDELVAAVRRAAGIDTYEHAFAAVTATATVLGRRLEGASSALTTVLPQEMRARLPTAVTTEMFPLDVFYMLVAATEDHGCSQAEVRRHVSATMDALRAKMGPALEDVLRALPADYDDLQQRRASERGALDTRRRRIPGQRRGVHDDEAPEV